MGHAVPLKTARTPRGLVFDVKRFAVHDGPGIRTVVFLKGCPLSCRWCCNPESINDKPELAFRQTLCDGCARCIDVCPKKALSLVKGTNELVIDRRLCDNCEACVAACPRKALTI
ncbi:MAG: 4Fe-4S binding protein, partial [Candidatus Aminicenantales bacterium]